MPRQGQFARAVSDEERADAVAMREQGHSLQEVAEKYGVTREAIRLWTLTDSTMTAYELRQAHKERKEAVANAAIREFSEQNPDAPLFEFPGITTSNPRRGSRYERIKEALSEEKFAHHKGMSFDSREYHGTYENDELVIAARRMYEFHAEPGQIFTEPFWDSHNPPLTGVRIIQIFGTWQEFCRQADLPFKAVRDNYVRKFPREACVKALNEFFDEVGPWGTYAAYDKWAQQDPGRPSGGTIRNRVHRRWSEARKQALAEKSTGLLDN